MAYQALYRKLRPYKFSEVFGQDDIVKTLQNQIKNSHIAHAYLFCGTRGTGKTSLAKIMACTVNCFNPQNNEPCGECKSCVSIKEESNMDVLELDAASRNKVENIHELLEQTNYPPQIGKYKVFIIDEVHMLSNSAFNALLKTLEEPPEYIIFILATTEVQKIPATILSRCQRYDLSRVSVKLISQKVQEALNGLGIKYDIAAVQEIAMAAEGSVRDAWSILDICIAGINENETLDLSKVEAMLGTAKKDFLFDFSKAIIKCDYLKLMNLSDNLYTSGKEYLVFIKQLSIHFRSLMLVKLTGDKSIDENISENDFIKFKEQSELIDNSRILVIIDMFMEAEQKLKWSSNQRIGFENIILHCASPIASSNIDSNIIDVINHLQTNINYLESKLLNTDIPSSKPVLDHINKLETNPSIKVKPKYDLDSNTSLIWKAILELAKKEITFFIFVRGSILVKTEDGFKLVYKHKHKSSLERISYPENTEKLLKLFEQVTGKRPLLKYEIESDPGDIKRSIDNSKNIESLLATLPRELLEISE